VEVHEVIFSELVFACLYLFTLNPSREWGFKFLHRYHYRVTTLETTGFKSFFVGLL